MTRLFWRITPTSISLIRSFASPGVGNVQVFGPGQYAMRMWVKPDKLAKLGITVPQIISAVQAQNTVNPAGKAGGEPVAQGSGIYLYRSGPGPSGVAGTIRTDRAARNAGWRYRPRAGCRPH